MGGEWAGDEGVQVFASQLGPSNGGVSLVNWERVGQRATVLNVHFYGEPEALGSCICNAVSYVHDSFPVLFYAALHILQ